MQNNYIFTKLRSIAQDFPPPPPPPPNKSRTLIFAIVIILVVVLVIASVAFLFMHNPPDVNPTPTPYPTGNAFPTSGPNVTPNYYSIQTGTKTQVTTQTVTASGGTIQVTDSSSPMNGLKIVVPQGATSESIQFGVSYADVSSINGLPDNCAVAGKMISIETSGSNTFNKYKMFNKPIGVTLPFDASDDHSSIVRYYYYDSNAGKLDSAGFLTEDDAAHTITFTTASFSDFVAIRTFLNFTGSTFGLDATVDTGFRPARDGWFIPNYGSYLDYSTISRPNSTIGGYCLGMVSFAKWYYSYIGTGFYSKYHEGDPNVWQDDATAIQLAARAHVATTGIWSDMNNEEKLWSIAYWNTADSRQVALSFIAGMIVTGQPQLMGLRTINRDGTWRSGGHAVLVYSYGNGNFEIYDPNYPGSSPGETLRQLPFTYNQGFSKNYVSSLNANDDAMTFNIFYHASAKLAGTPSDYQGLYNSAQKGFKDDSVFPVITVTDATTTPAGTTPVDTDGDGIRDTTEATATISGTITNQQGNNRLDQIQIFCDNVQYTAAVYSSGAFSFKIPLMAGVNDVALLATDASTFSEWAGFLRVPIKSSASPAAMTITLTWDQDNSDVDLHVLEPGTDGRHIYYSNMGGGGTSPYLDIDNTRGFGPEHYYATQDMTIPGSTNLYGTYQIRVEYYADHSGAETPQIISWHLKVRYLAFQSGSQEFWIEETRSGTLSTPSSSDTGNFQNSNPAWSAVWSIDYPAPNPQNFGIPNPPQNQFKWSP